MRPRVSRTVLVRMLTCPAAVLPAACSGKGDGGEGAETEVEPALQNFVEQFPFDGAGYRCDGDLLVFDITVGSAAHEMTLTAI